METIEINNVVLEQIDRQIGFAYFLGSSLTVLVFFVVGYQIFLNQRTIKKLREENERLIKEMTTPFFIININNLLKMGSVAYSDEVENLLAIFNKSYKDDYEIRSKMKKLGDLALEYQKSRMTMMHPDYQNGFGEENSSEDIVSLTEKVKKAIDEKSDLTEKEKTKSLKLVHEIYDTYQKIEKDFDIL